MKNEDKILSNLERIVELLETATSNHKKIKPDIINISIPKPKQPNEVIDYDNICNEALQSLNYVIQTYQSYCDQLPSLSSVDNQAFVDEAIKPLAKANMNLLFNVNILANRKDKLSFLQVMCLDHIYTIALQTDLKEDMIVPFNFLVFPTASVFKQLIVNVGDNLPSFSLQELINVVAFEILSVSIMETLPTDALFNVAFPHGFHVFNKKIDEVKATGFDKLELLQLNELLTIIKDCRYYKAFPKSPQGALINAKLTECAKHIESVVNESVGSLIPHGRFKELYEQSTILDGDLGIITYRFDRATDDKFVSKLITHIETVSDILEGIISAETVGHLDGVTKDLLLHNAIKLFKLLIHPDKEYINIPHKLIITVYRYNQIFSKAMLC